MTSKELLKIFSVNTRTICKNKGIKIGELEQTIGVSKGYLSRIISSDSAISLANIYNVSKILEVSIDDLLNKDFALEQRIAELEDELKLLKMQREI